MKDEKILHEAKVYTPQGKLNNTDSSETQVTQSKITSTQNTEVPDKSIVSKSAPKLCSTEIYSKSSSLSADFDSSQLLSSNNKKITYETANNAKIFGGLNTSADSKSGPSENSFDTKQNIDTR